MTRRVDLQSFVTVGHGNDVGKLVKHEGKMAYVEIYHSIANRPQVMVSSEQIQPTEIKRQTRCYYFSEQHERWIMGRIKKKVDDEYEVEFPDQHSEYIHESKLYVRSNRPIDDPMEVLEERGHETAFFNVRRSQFVKTLMDQRQAARGMTGLVSSNILLLPHQVEVVRRVLEDPVPRYLLADEVGLGKTIEAGAVLRQYLLDHPSEKALLIVPPLLIEQWRKEMSEKFYISQFEGRVHWMTTDSLNELNLLQNHTYGMVIVDEAHEVAAKAYSECDKHQNEYALLASITKHSEGLLLLSATPVLNNERGFLAMLHLLDPEYYRLEDLDSFKMKVEKRQDVGRLLLNFTEDTLPLILNFTVKNLAMQFESDAILQGMVQELQKSLSNPESNSEDRVQLIRKIRVHLSDTYRLHRRLLRNRRESVGDVLNYSRNTSQDSKLVKFEYDLDERTSLLEQYLDEWRHEAWASERNIWDRDQPPLRTDLSDLFFLLFETAGSSTGLFLEIVQSRLNRNATERVISDLEPRQLERLTNTPFFEGEEVILEQMIRLLSTPSEGGDRVVLASELVKQLKQRALKRQETPPKIVIFSSYASVIDELIKELRICLGSKAVAGYRNGMRQDKVEQQIVNFRQDSDCLLLVCDRSGEEGRNLQFADVLIHFDLPLSPNRIEQRSGRLDRIGREKDFTTYVFTGTEETESSLHFAWVKFLAEGLNVFNSSIAMFQFFIEDRMPQILARLYLEGISGVSDHLGELGKLLEEEKVRIFEQDALDSIDAREQKATHLYATLKEKDDQYWHLQEGVEAWILEALKLNRRWLLSKQTFYYTADLKTLVPLPYLQRLANSLERPHTYNRELAARTPSSILYRIGEPFLDSLAEYVLWDDRGQAYAFWRQVAGLPVEEGREAFVFRFEYVVEGDLGPAKNLLAEKGIAGIDLKALQRRLDRFFPAHTYTINVDMDGQQLVEPLLTEALQLPFAKRENGGNDINLTKERLEFFLQFSEQGWRESCREARKHSEQILRNSASFIENCNEHAERAQKDLSLSLAQLELRANRDAAKPDHQRQRDRKDLDLENDLNDALIVGIKYPKVRLDSVGFIALSGRAYP